MSIPRRWRGFWDEDQVPGLVLRDDECGGQRIGLAEGPFFCTMK